MRFRKLRIAFSVVSAIVCLLLVLLWVRSYQFNEIAGRQISKNRSVGVTSLLGRVRIGTWKHPKHANSWWVNSERLTNSVYEWAASRQGENAIGFGVISFQSNIELIMPCWFLVLLTATLAVIPCRHLANRFSLRTLLIATTLVAVALGAIVFAASK
jgi:hypothetical protein